MLQPIVRKGTPIFLGVLLKFDCPIEMPYTIGTNKSLTHILHRSVTTIERTSSQINFYMYRERRKKKVCILIFLNLLVNIIDIAKQESVFHMFTSSQVPLQFFPIAFYKLQFICLKLLFGNTRAKHEIIINEINGLISKKLVIV